MSVAVVPVSLQVLISGSRSSITSRPVRSVDRLLRFAGDALAVSDLSFLTLSLDLGITDVDLSRSAGLRCIRLSSLLIEVSTDEVRGPLSSLTLFVVTRTLSRVFVVILSSPPLEYLLVSVDRDSLRLCP